MRPTYALLFSLIAGCAATGGDVCEQAAEVIAECTGEEAAAPIEGCVGEFRATAEAVVAEGCGGLVGGGKADGFWCRPAVRWVGLCDEVPLKEAARMVSLDDACGSSSDPLCSALRDNDTIAARDAAAARYSPTDPAVRYFVRERVVSLVVHNVLSDRGHRALPADYAGAADGVLDEHFPAYADDDETFAMARTPTPALDGASCSGKHAVVFFPGVVRLFDRAEFVEQSAAVLETLPCVETAVVQSGSFVDPSINAEQAAAAIGELDPSATLHLVGYSQGSSNALRTLVDFPELAARTASVLTMNSAARGSEVADTFKSVIELLDNGDLCAMLPDFARPTCEFAAESSPRPAGEMMNLIAAGLAIPVDQLEAWIEAEDAVAAAPTLADFLVAHLPGIRSLTTEAAAQFWADRGADLPDHILYTSFASVISQPDRNLPPSNALFFHLLNRAGGNTPYNDMQVRLSNQRLRGPIAGNEVELPVAEGNHWQWELATGAVPDNVMSTDMTDRVPHRELLVAYVQALFDVGVID